MVMEEEAKLVPKNGSDCESNGASSAAANGKYDLCGRTPTSELSMDEISSASLIKHDDRSESILIGLRNCFLESLPGLLFSVLFGEACSLLHTKYLNRLLAYESVLYMLLLLAALFYFLREKDLNRDRETKQTEDISPIEEVHDSAADSISDTTDISPWERGGCIGTGGFGIVYVERNRKTGDLRAVKELRNIENAKHAESIRKEIKILCQLKHPNIIKYYGHEDDGNKISLYMEFIETGSLKKYISKHGGALNETTIRKFTAQILAGLVYLRDKRVVHRDLKPDNILVDSRDIVKLVDFGVSKHLVESVGKRSVLGTPYYAAPEVLKQEPYKSSSEAYAGDIWSLGCIIIEMFSGKHPWPCCKEPVQVIWQVCIENQCPPIPNGFCRDGKNFLECCFIRNPADRASAAELQDHPFVKPQSLSC